MTTYAIEPMTQADIINGYLAADSCPVALVIERSTSAHSVVVELSKVYIDGVPCFLPAHVRRFIAAFDSWQRHQRFGPPLPLGAFDLVEFVGNGSAA